MGKPSCHKKFFYSSWGGGAPAPGAPPAYAADEDHSYTCDSIQSIYNTIKQIVTKRKYQLSQQCSST